MSKQIVIIGMGRIGNAMRYLMKPELCVECFDTMPGVVQNQKKLEDSIPVADVVFLCIPSWAMRDCLLQIKSFVSPKTVFISVSKGIEVESQKTMEQVMEESLPLGQPFGVLIGPMMAEELLKDLGGAGVIASVHREVFDRSRAVLRPELFLHYSDDVHGVALAGVLKNIYALGLGIADALAWGQNKKGWFVSQAAIEMVSMMKELGGRKSTVIGPAGLGDLVATGFSCYSANRGIGEAIVKEIACEKQSGGKVSILPLMGLLGARAQAYPLLCVLDRIVNKGASAKEEYETFFS